MKKVNSPRRISTETIPSEFGDVTYYELLRSVIRRINEIIVDYNEMSEENKQILNDIQKYIVDTLANDEEVIQILNTLIEQYLPKPLSFSNMDFTGDSLNILRNGLPLMSKTERGVASVGRGLDVVNGVLLIDDVNITNIIDELIQSTSINGVNIVDNTITTSKLKNDIITNEKIVDNTITTSKLKNDIITNEKIVDNTITNEKINDKMLLRINDNNIISTIEGNKTFLPYASNLLINGDFQINQRSQIDYTGINGWKYTVDMWKINSYGHLIVNSGYVKFVNNNDYSGANYFSQDCDLKGTNTIGVKIRNYSGLASVRVESIHGTTAKEVIVNKIGVISFSYTGDIKRISIEIVGASSYVEIEHITIYEGNIVYPYQKENSAIALTRCKHYLNRFSVSIPYAYEYEGYQYMLRIPHDKMFKISTITSFEYVYFDNSGNDVTGNSFTHLAQTERMIELRTSINNRISQTSSGISVYIMISCEPL